MIQDHGPLTSLYDVRIYMATTDANPIFADTNVLVYANVAAAPLHAIAIQAIQDPEQAGVKLWISRQVIREYLAVLRRRPLTAS